MTITPVVALLAVLGFASCAAADEIVDDPYVLAPAAVRTGDPVDGIPSGPMVDNGYHVHAHLTIFVDGAQRWVPAGVGVIGPVTLFPDREDPVIEGAMAFYSLHTHDESGVVHAEAKEPQPFTLGQFFDIWGQPLDRHRVGPANGDVTAWVNGSKYAGDPRLIVLGRHTVVQLNIGRDVPFQDYDFPRNF